MAEKRKAAGPPAVVVAVLLLPLLARLQVTSEILVVGHLCDLLVGVGVADDVPIEEKYRYEFEEGLNQYGSKIRY